MGYLMLFHYLQNLGLDYHLEHLRLRGRQLRLLHLARDDQAAERQDVRRGQAPRASSGSWAASAATCGACFNQYMDTMNGPADFLEVPVSPDHRDPVRERPLHQDGAHRRVHRRPDPATASSSSTRAATTTSRSPSTTPATPRAAWACFEEPRYVIQNVCNHFYEMPENTIREQTFCCGSGAGLNAGENMEMRLRGGLPRANAVKHVQREARGQHAGLHLRHRPGGAADR